MAATTGYNRSSDPTLPTHAGPPPAGAYMVIVDVTASGEVDPAFPGRGEGGTTKWYALDDLADAVVAGIGADDLTALLDGTYQPAGSYAPAAHTHDDRYYTEAESDALLDALDAAIDAVADDLAAHEAAADPHAGYALLAGRAGGQTISGGTASGESLKLRSTSDATEGDIEIGGAGFVVRPYTAQDINGSQVPTHELWIRTRGPGTGGTEYTRIHPRDGRGVEFSGELYASSFRAVGGYQTSQTTSDSLFFAHNGLRFRQNISNGRIDQERNRYGSGSRCWRISAMDPTSADVPVAYLGHTQFELAQPLVLPTLADGAALAGSLYLGSDHLDGNGQPQLCRKDALGNVNVIG